MQEKVTPQQVKTSLIDLAEGVLSGKVDVTAANCAVNAYKMFFAVIAAETRHGDAIDFGLRTVEKKKLK